MGAFRPDAADACIVAFSGSLIALGCFNLASDVQADVLQDYRHFVPTRVQVEGEEFVDLMGEPTRRVRSDFRWDTVAECNLNSRLYNFCSGKSTVFEWEVILSNYHTDRHEWRWADHNTGYYTNLPLTNYLDTPLDDPDEEFHMDVGTLGARDIHHMHDYYTVVFSSPGYDGPNWFKVQASVGINNLGRLPGGCPRWYLPPQLCMTEARDRFEIIPFIYHWTFPGESPVVHPTARTID